MQGKNVHITDWKTSQKAYINLHSHGDVTIAGEGLQSLGLCFVLLVWVGRDVYRVPSSVTRGPRVLRSYWKVRHNLVPLYDKQGLLRAYHNPEVKMSKVNDYNQGFTLTPHFSYRWKPSPVCTWTTWHIFVDSQ